MARPDGESLMIARDIQWERLSIVGCLSFVAPLPESEERDAGAVA